LQADRLGIGFWYLKKMWFPQKHGNFTMWNIMILRWNMVMLMWTMVFLFAKNDEITVNNGDFTLNNGEFILQNRIFAWERCFYHNHIIQVGFCHEDWWFCQNWWFIKHGVEPTHTHIYIYNQICIYRYR
jgi:hypothetical protein